jgi:hypothetical protein
MFSGLPQSDLSESAATFQLGITLDDAKNITVTDGPPIDAVVIPFFCAPPSAGIGV